MHENWTSEKCLTLFHKERPVLNMSYGNTLAFDETKKNFRFQALNFLDGMVKLKNFVPCAKSMFISIY